MLLMFAKAHIQLIHKHLAKSVFNPNHFSVIKQQKYLQYTENNNSSKK